MSADEPPVFPYEILWAGFGNAFVSLRELERNREEYALLNETTDAFHPELQTITISEIETVLKRHYVDASESQIEAIWLTCAFYLAPKQAKAFGIDPDRSRQLLRQAAATARRLDRTLSKIGPKVYAALYWKRPHVPDIERPQGPEFNFMQVEVRDFARVAGEASVELTNFEGRPRHHHRNTMLRLLIELIREIGLEDLKVSNGTKIRPEPHLGGNAGQLLCSLVSLIEPSWDEAWLAPKVKPILRVVRKQLSGEKTRIR